MKNLESHLCTIKKCRGFTKITPIVRSEVNKWIINHTHVIVPPITNYCIKIQVYGKILNNSASRLLLKIYVREIHNDMVWYMLQGGS